MALKLLKSYPFRVDCHCHILRKISAFHRFSSFKKNEKSLILGIETSCDDTGVAVLSSEKEILGEAISTQTTLSTRFGGVIPSLARKLHEKKIQELINEALLKANIMPQDLTAIAVTVKPGLRQSLKIGLKHATNIAIEYKKPLIPIHHMESHALTARLLHKIEFPFLVLLISGGHCILAIGEDIDKWSILGKGLDESPGKSFDHVARRLKLRNLKGFENMCGGKAVETLAAEGDSKIFPLKVPHSYVLANFSFSGPRSNLVYILEQLEKEKGIEGNRVVPEAKDLCASFQLAVTRHLVRQTHKAMQFIDYKKLIPAEKRTLVISGGVASNQFIRNAFEGLCKDQDYQLFIPPPRFCTDNGVMIAWNGLERWNRQKGILWDSSQFKDIIVQNKCPMGEDLSFRIVAADIRQPTTWVV